MPDLPPVTDELLGRAEAFCKAIIKHDIASPLDTGQAEEHLAIIQEVRRLREFVQAVYDFRMEDGERLPFNTCDYHRMEELGASYDKQFTKERKSALYMSERIDAESQAQALRDAAKDHDELAAFGLAPTAGDFLRERADEIEGNK